MIRDEAACCCLHKDFGRSFRRHGTERAVFDPRLTVMATDSGLSR